MKLTAALTLTLLAASPALAAPYSFTALPSGFLAAAINNTGQIGGTTRLPGAFAEVSAVYANGAFAFPPTGPTDSYDKVLTGINDAGDILGIGSRGRVPFAVFGGVVTGFAAPGNTSSGVQAYGLNNARQIVGSAAVDNGQGSATVGYVSSGSAYAVVAVPGQGATSPTGINNAGDIVGSYQPAGTFDPAVAQGFLDHAGTFTTILVPGAVGTASLAVNDAGEIAGTYTAADGSRHGFTETGGVFSDVTGPDGAAFSPAGLNNAGQLVGTSDGGGLSYLATPAPASSVPEPASALLLGGLVTLGAVGRWRGALRV